MERLAIVADDLTGALDAAAPFAARGFSTMVALGIDGLDAALATSAEIVGVSTDSREISPNAARDAVADCLAKLPSDMAILKKIDSRLKGNIEAELDAMSFERGLAIPAIPAFGRWMRDGRLGGFGVQEPIDIAGILGRHARRISVPDASTQADIEHALSSDEHDLHIGARSLAEALAARRAPDAPPAILPDIMAPVICIIGSTDPITLAQIERLRVAGGAIDYRAAPNGVVSDVTPPKSDLTIIQALPGDASADPIAVAHGLAAALRQIGPPAGATLVISGGATAQIVLRALDITVLQLLGEALPGLPIARAGGFTVITKSGGFGQPEALVDLLGHLAGTRRGSKA